MDPAKIFFDAAACHRNFSTCEFRGKTAQKAIFLKIVNFQAILVFAGGL